MPEPLPNIIAETDDVLVIDKPAGLIVHSDGRTIEPSLAAWLLERYQALEHVGEPWVSPQGERILIAGIVHRLDRTTSGVMLVAKTPETFAYLKGEFKARRVEKIYRAFVYGHVEADEGTIVAKIMRSSEPPRRWYARACASEDKRAAITKWRVLERFEDDNEPVSYLELSPKTGRTHQLRVHLASIGHPIVGDHLYAPASLSRLGFTRPALHAHRISFIFAGEYTTYTAPLPENF